MTSAPVKDVNSLMNFVGGKNLTKTGGMNQTGSFGDVMSKARNESFGSSSQSVTGKQSVKVSTTAQSRHKEAVRTENTAKEAVSTDDMGAKQQALEEAGKEVVNEIAKELDVTVEDVERAMEELGLSVYSLLDPSNLTQLMLQLSGEQDATALLTDEGLFASLQNVLSAVTEVKKDFMQEMNLEPEDMQALLEAMKAGEGTQAEGDVEAGSADMAEQEASSRITVEVKAGGEKIRLTTDEKGNVTGNATAIPSDAEKGITENHADSNKGSSSDGKKGQSESMMHTGSQMIDALLQNKVQAAESAFEQTPAFFNEQTQDIMNQIMDYMKIQLKPGMDQLEMQLHPASLGTVQVQLINKGGEITAQFHVQNETVKAAIESQIMTLQENLKEQGVKVQAVQVTVENHGFESNLWQGQGREENASSQNNKRMPRRINLNDLDGNFEEEVSEEDVITARMMKVNGNTVDYTA